jgi:hypothetical protein
MTERPTNLRATSVYLAIPAFYRIAWLNDRYTWIALTLMSFPSRLKTLSGQTKDHLTGGIRPVWSDITLAGRFSGVRTQIGHFYG